MESVPTTVLMGIVNVTPDSFSDGGLYEDQEIAVAHALKLVDDGADIIDVGGESTRPGAFPITIAQETYRVIPVITELARQGVTVSIDTMHAEVAAKAVAAGATYINDVTGGLADPAIVQIAADAGVYFIASHYRAPAGSPDTHVSPLAEVLQELTARRDYLLNAGIAPEKLVLDPGLGFAKKAQTNWAILCGIPELNRLGHPVLIGASRKRFLKELLGSQSQTQCSLDGNELERATAAVTALAAAQGVWGVRVHDVAANRQAIAVASAWKHPV